MHFSAPSSIFFKVAFWWLLKSFKMVTRHKKLVAIKKKKETLGVILHEGNIDYWYFMFCIKLFQQHDRWAQVAKLATFTASWVSNTYIFLLVMASKMAAAWSAVFAIFFVLSQLISTHLHVVCHYFICLMLLFQGHVACCNFTVKTPHE